MNVFEFTVLDTEDMLMLSKDELKQALLDVQGSVNRRYHRIQKSGVHSPAVKGMEASGGEISVKGKTLNQLRHEYRRAQNFLSNKSSTIRGSKKIVQEEAERIGLKYFSEWSDESKTKMYDTYNKITERIPEEVLRQNYGGGTNEVQKRLTEMMIDDPDLSVDDMVNKFLDEYSEMIGEEEEEWNEEMWFDEEEDEDEFDYF